MRGHPAADLETFPAEELRGRTFVAGSGCSTSAQHALCKSSGRCCSASTVPAWGEGTQLLSQQVTARTGAAISLTSASHITVHSGELRSQRLHCCTRQLARRLGNGQFHSHSKNARPHTWPQFPAALQSHSEARSWHREACLTPLLGTPSTCLHAALVLLVQVGLQGNWLHELHEDQAP